MVCMVLYESSLLCTLYFDLFQEELHQARLKELDEMTSERDAARLEFESMRKQRLDLFMAGFSVITNKLKEMYQVGGRGFIG